MEVLREVQASQLSPPLYVLREWETRYGLTTGVTARGGRSDDFGLGSDVPAAEVFSRWLSLPQVVGGGFSQTCTGRQVHGTCVRRHTASEQAGQWILNDGVDGHVTANEGVLLTVTIADCVPVFLYAQDTGDLGLLHAGWRGVASGILEEGIDEMTKVGANLHKIALHLGPAICGDCYEVGPEVAKRLGQAANGHQRVDLRAILAQKAGEKGLEWVSMSAWCTKHDQQFHSYRRDGAQSGRMVAYVGKR